MTQLQRICNHNILHNESYTCSACSLPWDEVEASRHASIKDNKPPKQVGGSHYEQAIEPIQYIEANNLPFAEANVVKYVSRHRRKNGKEDLLKVIWYVQHIIDTEYSND